MARFSPRKRSCCQSGAIPRRFGSNGRVVPSKGREVIYSSVLDPRMIFVHMPATAIPLPVMKIPVDSPLVMRNSRHAITEAGLDTIVENLRKSERGDDATTTHRGGLSYKGTEKPAGLNRTCHHFVRDDGDAAKRGMFTSTSARCCRRWWSPRIRMAR